MTPVDVLRFAAGALRGYPTRTLLMILAMAIGVAAVIVLTALGEGARRYVVNQFSSIGTHLVIVFPGRSETSGTGMLLSETTRDLTLDDALALQRSPAIARIAPLNIGAAAVAWQRRSRDVTVMGSTEDLLGIRHMELAQGNFLPTGDPRRAAPVVVIGATVRDELFGAHVALGEWVRIGDRRFRVIGVLASQGQAFGTDTDELVVVPVASAEMLFNSPSLFRILIEAKSREAIERARTDAISILKERHEGEEDVTVVTQDAVLATFDRILRALTLALGGIAAVSLAVAGILIMNVMLIAVSQRTKEVGLLKAVGASPQQIRRLFFTEAVMLSSIGALTGLAIGQLGSMLIVRLYPTLPAAAPAWAIAAAFGTALFTGIVFSLLPARRAARLDPVQALARR